jgi:ribose 5-phosphate isomerase B
VEVQVLSTAPFPPKGGPRGRPLTFYAQPSWPPFDCLRAYNGPTMDRRQFLASGAASIPAPPSPPMPLVIGSDHAGFPMKGPVIQLLKSWGHSVKDCGCFSTDPVDFPDIARLVCADIKSGRATRGILVCGTGIGATIAGNKIRGIRAALCHDTYSAHQSVEHDDVNLLCMGAWIIGPKLAEEILHAFLGARFSTSEEFRRRVRKLEEMEKER